MPKTKWSVELFRAWNTSNAPHNVKVKCSSSNIKSKHRSLSRKWTDKGWKIAGLCNWPKNAEHISTHIMVNTHKINCLPIKNFSNILSTPNSQTTFHPSESNSLSANARHLNSTDIYTYSTIYKSIGQGPN